jgi:predicted RNA binding protein YcfA (HicA-like mRNA interferase family)
MTPDGKTGTVVPVHDELKPGTLRSVLRLAKIDIDDFYQYI